MVPNPKTDTAEVVGEECCRPSAGQLCLGHGQMLFIIAAEEARPGLVLRRWGGTERRELGQGSKKQGICEGSDPSDSYSGSYTLLQSAPKSQLNSGPLEDKELGEVV